MRKLILIVFITCSFNLYAQEYDLVVTRTGDSIACHIDSISAQRVYFEMKFYGKWLHTDIFSEDVLVYRYNHLFKDSIRFQSNSSYLKPYNTIPRIDRPKTNINLMVFGYASLISMNVERLFFINDKLFICIDAGVGYNEEFLLFSDREPYQYFTYPHHLTLSYGRKRNFVESGLGGTYINGKTSQHYLFYPIIGYRLQPINYNKVNFRAFIYYPFTGEVEDILFVVFGASVGLSF